MRARQPGDHSDVLGPPPPAWRTDFANLDYEWRRLFAEIVGTFFLILTAAGAGVVNAATGGSVGRTASVVAPALMVMAIILAFGAVSGAHLNPVVSVAFALRGEFPWRRVPLYLVAQIAGGLLACLFLPRHLRDRRRAWLHDPRSAHQRSPTQCSSRRCVTCGAGDDDSGDRLGSPEA